MSEDLICLRREGDVVRLMLNRPDRLNALSIDLLRELRAKTAQAVEGGARALLITGAGRAFCSGADLNGGAARASATDMGLGVEQGVNPLLEDFAALPIPIVTAVNGPAVGAGAGLALAGDFALMGRSAFLQLAFAKVGLAPDTGLMFHLPRLIGRQRALEMMMLGERVSAEEAASLGLVYRAVEDEELETAAAALAQRLAAGPTRAFMLIRTGMRKALDLSLTETLKLERDNQRAAGETADFVEGVAAFKARRTPVFSGR